MKGFDPTAICMEMAACRAHRSTREYDSSKDRGSPIGGEGKGRGREEQYMESPLQSFGDAYPCPYYGHIIMFHKGNHPIADGPGECRLAQGLGPAIAEGCMQYMGSIPRGLRCGCVVGDEW